MFNQIPFQQNGAPGFIADLKTREHVLPGGAKLDAAQFISADAIAATVGAAGAAAGATSIPVAALLGAIPQDTVLNFGARAAVVVVVGAAGAIADATTVPVDALTGPLPDGTLLDFGGKKFARLTAAAATGATSLTVAALATGVADNDTATYPAVSARTAKTTAAAAKGAVALTVEALPEGLAEGDAAHYVGPTVKKRIPRGTLLGLTNGELEGASVVTDGIPAGALWGKATDGDDIVRLSVYDIIDADENNDVDLVRPGTLIYVNHLPGWSTLSGTLKNKIRATYEVTVGATEV